MKTIFKKTIIVSSLAALFLSVGCTESSEGFLDSKADTVVDRLWVFSDSTRTEQYLANVYSKLIKPYFAEQGGTGYYADWDGATDNTCLLWTGGNRMSNTLAFNDYSSYLSPASCSEFLTKWSETYVAINTATTFLLNVDQSPLSASRKERMKAEARFLRSYYYYYLLTYWGGVPLLKDNVYGDSDIPKETRATYAEMVDYIVSEMDAIIPNLPTSYEATDFGRIERGAALALKAKVLWLAASPLSNGGNVGTDETKAFLGYDSYDVNRWQKAKTAIEAVLNAGYSLVEDNATRPGYGFYLVTTTRKNTECLFKLLLQATGFTSSYLLPASRGGQHYQYPYQELVDAFPMKTGESIKASGTTYNPAKPYENRDPRFYNTIIYDGAKWITSYSGQTLGRVNLYYKATTDGMGYDSYSTYTGYILRKFVKESSYGSSGANDSGFPIFRLADFMLMYAEALTELDVDANRSTIENQLFAIRRRAGIVAGANQRYGVPANMTKDEMIAFIINERRIEFVGEGGIRFVDLLRRKLKENLNDYNPTGIKWTGYDSKTQTCSNFEIITVRKPFKFSSPRDYHFAIPLSEFNRSNGALIQNPGWK